MPLHRTTSAAIDEIWEQVHSPAGLPFPKTVAALLQLGVTRYAIDYVSCSVTTFVAGGSAGVHVAKIPDFRTNSTATTPPYNEAALRAAIHRAQAGEGNYHDFANAMVHAGVVGYLSFLTGQRVVYYGEKGEWWVELFPGAT